MHSFVVIGVVDGVQDLLVKDLAALYEISPVRLLVFRNASVAIVLASSGCVQFGRCSTGLRVNGLQLIQEDKSAGVQLLNVFDKSQSGPALFGLDLIPQLAKISQGET